MDRQLRLFVIQDAVERFSEIERVNFSARKVEVTKI